MLRLMKMHGYINAPPCICTPYIFWFGHGTKGIFRLWAFREYILLWESAFHEMGPNGSKWVHSVHSKWCLSLLSVVMIKLQVRVWKLTKMHDYFNIPPCIICTPCIICFRRDTSGIFGPFSGNIYFYVYQMFIIKSKLNLNVGFL